MNTDQEKENQYPQWMEDAKKWQSEDEENRACVIMSIDGKKLFGITAGNRMALVTAILNALASDEQNVELFDNAMELHKDQFAKFLYLKLFSMSRNIL